MPSLVGSFAILRSLLLTGILLCLAALPVAVQAQISPEEHKSHHPEEGDAASPEADPATGTGGPPAGAGGPGGGMMGPGGMGKMMEKMGAPKPRQLYPTLMGLPDLPMEERQEVELRAHDRMKAGAALMSEGFEKLTQSAPTDDFKAMQEAVNSLREGVAQFDSGLAAHRALAEGKAPRDVALQWFKSEMNLLPPESEPASGVLGMSWFHFFVMLLLILFAAVMIAMYFFKMRRASQLLERIAQADPHGQTTPGSAVSSNVSNAPADLSPAPVAAEPKSENPPERKEVASHDCCTTADGACETEAAPDATSISKGLLHVAEKKLCKLRVVRIVQETPDVKTFRFVACHGGGIPFSFLPGQFLTLTLPVGEKPIRRSYTIASSPTQGYYCEITVKREDQGAGSRYLHDQIQVGDTLEARAPSGRFTFTGDTSDSVVLIAGGVGITPMMSIVRALTDMVWTGDIYFIVGCQDPEHFIFESELKELAAQYENLHLFVAMSRIEKDMDGYRKGRLSKEMLSEWVPDLGSKWVHLCGAPPMMDAVKTMLTELGVAADRIHTENFGSSQKPKAKVAEGQEEAAEEAEAKATAQKVTFTTSDVTTDFQPDETVLEASERVDVNIDYSCRVGTCGECRVKLLSGEVDMETEDGLEPGDEEQGIILACQAKPESDLSVEA